MQFFITIIMRIKSRLLNSKHTYKNDTLSVCKCIKYSVNETKYYFLCFDY